MPYVHHTVLHFAIGLAFLPPLLGVLAWRRDHGAWRLELRLVVYLIVAVAIVASASGLLSAGHVIASGMSANKVELHRNLALGATAAWCLLGAATWYAARGGAPGSYKKLTVASAAAAGFVSLAAHFGGDMLHPGLAPWATAPHSHRPASEVISDHPAPSQSSGSSGPSPSMSAGAHGDHDPH